MLTAAVTPRRCHEVDPFNAGRRAVGVAFSTDASLRLPIRCFRRRLAPRRPADLGGFGWRYLGSTPPYPPGRNTVLHPVVRGTAVGRLEHPRYILTSYIRRASDGTRTPETAIGPTVTPHCPTVPHGNSGGREVILGGCHT